ncbi:MAG: hypothetical protein J0L92_07410, partial [Deltaproteobacteria bacterium]|nr:hypothetical protein [Deltaproteobacteria bacterium]
MRSLIARPLLRRIALGLPLAAWPLLSLPGCGQECSPGPAMTSSHPLTDALRGRIAPGGTLDRSRCRPECLELDGATPTDAGSRADDAGPSSVDRSFALSAEVTCGVNETGTLLDCAYRGPAICRSVGCQFPGAVAGRAPSGLLAAHT